MKPLHVLMIPSFYPSQEVPLNGIFFKEQALMLKKQGVKIGVIYPQIRPLKQIRPTLALQHHFQTSYAEEEGLPTMRLHGWNLFPGWLKGTRHLWSHAARYLFQKYIQKQGRPDMIHAHSAVWGGISASELAEREKIPFLLTEHRDQFLHGTEFSKKWLLADLKKTFQQSKNNFSVSRALQDRLMQQFPASPFTRMPNFVDDQFFNPDREKPPLKPFIFLTIAHLVKSKNMQCLLHAFQMLLQVDSQIRLQIVGDGPEKGALVQLADQLKITDRVKFLGEQPRASIKEIYSKAHLLVLPSLYETFGVVFVEALLMGLPVIGTLCGGPEDIITPETGLLIEKNEPKELHTAMHQLKETYHLYPPEKLRKYAMSHFGQANGTRQLIEVYSRLKNSSFLIQKE